MTEQLRPRSLPPGDDWASEIGAETDAWLATAADLVARIKDRTPRAAADALALWNDTEIALRNAGALVGLLAQVHPDEQVRTVAEDREQAVERFITGVGLDRELFDVVAALDPAGLDVDLRRLLARTLRDFRRSGVDRDDAVRERLRELAERATVAGQQFARAIRDDVRHVTLRPDQLAGLPEDFIAAHPPGADGLVTLSTDYPDVIPFRTFASDAAARRELMLAFHNRAWPANDALLHELLSLRAERAGLLGYASWADYDAEVKMIRSGAAIAEFIDRIAELAEAPARRDFDVLLERRRRDDPTATGLDTSSSTYYTELVRREQFDVDAQLVRRYFDFARVRAGLLDVTGRLFDVHYEPVPDAPTWHGDVSVYDVLRDGIRIGRIYLDLHPRAGKYKHAAQFDLAPGIADRQLAEGALVCNFGRGLIEHTDVVTLFHEFGHLMHHVLGGGGRIARFSGVATEWDFVEAPSQMLEEWAWDADILRSFARDADGTPIPADLVERMRAAKEFGKGLQARTQMFYAALSYRLHVEQPADIAETARELQARYDLFDHMPGTHFHTSFGHLEGYTSGYYTYMWSLVIAKDLFSAFDPADLFATATAHRYRDAVLAPGGNADAADLVADFLGRPSAFEAFGRWLAEVPAAVRPAG